MKANLIFTGKKTKLEVTRIYKGDILKNTYKVNILINDILQANKKTNKFNSVFVTIENKGKFLNSWNYIPTYR